jgi:hypothetical protein
MMKTGAVRAQGPGETKTRSSGQERLVFLPQEITGCVSKDESVKTASLLLLL